MASTAAQRKASTYVKNEGRKHGYSSIATWTLNAGKSLGLSAIKAVTERTPVLKGMISENRETAKEIYENIKDFHKVVDAIKNNEAFVEYTGIAQEGISNILSDIKTGKFYNKERIEKVEMEMMGLDDFGDFGDFDFGDDDFGDFGVGDELPDFDDDLDSDTKALVASDRESDMYMANTIDNVGSKVSAAVGAATAKSARYVVASQDANARALMTGQSQIFNQVSTGFLGVKTSLANVEQIIEPLHTHMQNASVFYTKTTEQNEKIINLLEQIQENTKPATAEQQYKNQKGQSWIDSDGVINLGSMIDTFKENWWDAFTSTDIGSLFDFDFHMFGEGQKGNMLRQFTASPISLLMTSVIGAMLPKDFKKSLDSFDKTFGIFTSQIAKRINKWKDDDNFFKQLIGNIFGAEDTFKTKADPSKYHKGKVDFDGMTRKAIIDVIPTYLSKILVALTGGKETRFDYKTGKFISEEKIKREREDITNSAASNVGFGLNFEVSDFYDAYAANHTNETFDIDLGDVLERYFKHLVSVKKDPEYINERAKYKQGDAKKFGLKNLDEIVAVQLYYRWLLENGKKDLYMRLPGIVDRERSYITEQFENMDQDSVQMALEDNTLGSAGRRTFGHSRFVGELMNFQYSQAPTNAQNANKGKSNRTQYYDRLDRINSAKTDVDSTYLDDDIPELKQKDFESRIKELRGLKLSETKIGELKRKYDAIFIRGKKDSNNIKERKKFIRDLDTLKKNSSGNSYKRFLMDDDDEEIEYLEDELQDATGMERIGIRIKLTRLKAQKFLGEPLKIVTTMLDQGDKALYSLLYGKEEGHEEESIIGLMMKRTKEMWDKMEHHLIDKGKEFLDAAAYQLFGSKWDDVKDWTKQKTKAIIKNVGEIYKQWAGSLYNNVADKLYKGNKSIYQETDQWDYRTRKEKKNDEKISDYAKANNIDERDLRSYSEGENLNSGLELRRFGNEFYYIDDYGQKVTEFNGQSMPIDTKKNWKGNGSKLMLASRFWGGASEEKQSATHEALDKVSAGVKRAGEKIVNSKTADTVKDHIWNALTAVYDGLFPTEDKEGRKKIEGGLKDTLQLAFKQLGMDPSGAIAGGLLGIGGSILTGGLIGPVFGGAIGAGLGLVARSKALQDALFGTEETDENGNVKHKAGLLGDKVSSFIKEKLPSVTTASVAGTIGGLLIPGVPGGPLGGLIIGTGLGILSKSEGFKAFLFGDVETGSKGILGKGGESGEFLQKVKKSLPRAIAGALGGAAVGALTPFGIMPSIFVGSAIGFASESEKFKEVFFGKEVEKIDAEGNKYTVREGGVLGHVRERVIEPLRQAIIPIANELKVHAKNIARSVSGAIQKAARSVFESIKVPFIHKMEDYLLKPLGKKVFSLVKPVFDIVTSPLQVVKGIGQHYRDKQVLNGTATYMSAQERLDYLTANESRLRRKLGGKKKIAAARERDEILKGMSAAELRGMANSIKDYDKWINSYSRLRSESAKNIYNIARDCRLDAKAAEKIVQPYITKPDPLNKTAEMLVQDMRDAGYIVSEEQADAIVTNYKNYLDENSAFELNVKGQAVSADELAKRFGIKNNSKELAHLMDLAKAEAKVAEKGREGGDENTEALKDQTVVIENTGRDIVNILSDIYNIIGGLISENNPRFKMFFKPKVKYNSEGEEMTREETEESASEAIDLMDDVTKEYMEVQSAIHNKKEEEAAAGGYSGLLRARKYYGTGIISSLLGNAASAVGSMAKSAISKAKNLGKDTSNDGIVGNSGDIDIDGNDSLDDGNAGMDMTNKENREKERRRQAELNIQRTSALGVTAISKKFDALLEYLGNTKENKNKGGLLGLLIAGAALLFKGGLKKILGGVKNLLVAAGKKLATLVPNLVGSILNGLGLKGVVDMAKGKFNEFASKLGFGGKNQNIQNTAIEDTVLFQNKTGDYDNAYLSYDENGNKIYKDASGNILDQSQLVYGNNLANETLSERYIHSTGRQLLTGRMNENLGYKFASGLAESTGASKFLKGTMAGRTIAGIGDDLAGSALDVSRSKAMMDKFSLDAINSNTALNMTEKLGKFVDAIGKIPGIGPKIQPAVAEAMEHISKTLNKKLTTEAIKGAADIAKKALVAINVAFIVADFTTGYQDARSTLGVENPTTGQKILSGLIRALKNQVPFVGALIPDRTIVDIFVKVLTKVFPNAFKGFQEQRDEAEAKLAAINQSIADTGTWTDDEGNVHTTQEQFTDWNDYQKRGLGNYTWTEKIQNKMQPAINKVREKAGEMYSAVKNKVTEVVEQFKEAGAVEAVKDMFGFVAKGEVTKLLEYSQTTEQDIKDSENNGMFAPIITRIVTQAMKPVLMGPTVISFLGHKLFDGAKKNWPTIKNSIKSVATNVFNVNRYALTGDLEGLWNYDVKTNLDENNPMAGLITTGNTIYKMLSFPKAIIIKIGRTLFEKVGKPIIKSVVPAIGDYTNELTSIIDNVLHGNGPKDIWDKSKSKGIFDDLKENGTLSDEYPLAGIMKVVKMATRVAVTPISISSWIGHKAWDIIGKPLVKVGKAMKELNPGPLFAAAYDADWSKVNSLKIKVNDDDDPFYKVAGHFSNLIAYAIATVRTITHPLVALFKNSDAEGLQKGDISYTNAGPVIYDGENNIMYYGTHLPGQNDVAWLGNDEKQKEDKEKKENIKESQSKTISVKNNKEVKNEFPENPVPGKSWINKEAGKTYIYDAEYGWQYDHDTYAKEEDYYGNVYEGGKSGLRRFRGGSSFVSQVANKIAGRKFGKSTIAANGCAPAVKAMITGNSLEKTANAALSSGKVNENGTSADYFNDVAREYIFTGNGSGVDRIASNIASGRPTVLLGQDRSNTSKANSPFGPGNHYVLATGMTKNGGVIVQDPEASRGNLVYDKSILNSVKLGIPTGGSSLLGLYRGGSYNSEEGLQIWQYLKGLGLSDAAAAGVMGCFEAESSNSPNRVEGDYLKDFPGYDAIYNDPNVRTAWTYSIIDRTNAITDKANAKNNYTIDGVGYPGIGLAQWTKGRAYNLWKFAEDEGLNWANLGTQLKFFTKEVSENSGYNATVENIRNSDDVDSATRTFALGYEHGKMPEKMINERIAYARDIFKTYAGVEGDVSVAESAIHAPEYAADYSVQGEVGTVEKTSPDEPDNGSIRYNGSSKQVYDLETHNWYDMGQNGEAIGKKPTSSTRGFAYSPGTNGAKDLAIKGKPTSATRGFSYTPGVSGGDDVRKSAAERTAEKVAADKEKSKKEKEEGPTTFISALTDYIRKGFGKVGELLGFSPSTSEEKDANKKKETGNKKPTTATRGTPYTPGVDGGNDVYGKTATTRGFAYTPGVDGGNDVPEAIQANYDLSNPTEAQRALVDIMESIKGTLAYSMEGPRDPDQKSADCSSTVNWAYKKIFGNSVGSTTLDFLNSDKFTTVDMGQIGEDGTFVNGASESVPNFDNLMPGDILLFTGSFENALKRKYHVGHIEMYMGDGKSIGHGKNNGPQEHNVATDFKKRYIMSRRYNPIIESLVQQQQEVNNEGSLRNQGYSSSTNGTQASNLSAGLESARKRAANASSASKSTTASNIKATSSAPSIANLNIEKDTTSKASGDITDYLDKDKALSAKSKTVDTDNFPKNPTNSQTYKNPSDGITYSYSENSQQWNPTLIDQKPKGSGSKLWKTLPSGSGSLIDAASYYASSLKKMSGGAGEMSMEIFREIVMLLTHISQNSDMLQNILDAIKAINGGATMANATTPGVLNGGSSKISRMPAGKMNRTSIDKAGRDIGFDSSDQSLMEMSRLLNLVASGNI